MPNIKSAKKRVKVIAAKTERNKAINSALKTDIKKANIAIEANAENKAEAVRVALRAIDKATAKGILHKNTAARRKISGNKIRLSSGFKNAITAKSTTRKPITMWIQSRISAAFLGLFFLSCP